MSVRCVSRRFMPQLQLWQLPLSSTRERAIQTTRAATVSAKQHTGGVTAITSSAAEQALLAPGHMRGTGALALSISQDCSAVMWRVSAAYLSPMRRFAFSDPPRFGAFVVAPPPRGPAVLLVVGVRTFFLDCDAVPKPPPPTTEPQPPLDWDFFGSAQDASVALRSRPMARSSACATRVPSGAATATPPMPPHVPCGARYRC